MQRLEWAQVRAHRVRRNHLDIRARKSDRASVVADMCGIQAQLLPAAELALWARIEGIKRGDLQDWLFKDRTLFRTWSMRATLHVLPSSQFRMYVGALKTRTGYRKGAWLRYFGVSLEEIDRIIVLTGQALDKGPLTKKELAEKISRSLGEHLREKILSGWGELLKPAAYNGLLARGPDKDGEATYIRADKWLGVEADKDSVESMKNVLRHYLRSYGPAKPEGFAKWWGTQAAPAKRVFKSVEDELVQVDVEGHHGSMLLNDQEVTESTSTTSVRLLPNFDSYVIGFCPRDSFVQKSSAGLVFRPQAWVSPVVLVDGRIAGIWERRNTKRGDELVVRLFTRLTNNQRDVLRDEVDRMGVYYGSDLVLSFFGKPS